MCPPTEALCQVSHSAFCNGAASTEIYTLSLHDALPIYFPLDVVTDGLMSTYQTLFGLRFREIKPANAWHEDVQLFEVRDRKSTRLNSSHGYISYAVFCLKKKKHSNEQLLRKATSLD